MRGRRMRMYYSHSVWQSSNKKSILSNHIIETGPYCYSSKNEYIPVFAFKNGVFVSNNVKQEVIYSPFIPTTSRYNASKTEHSNLLSNIVNGDITHYSIDEVQYITSKFLLFTFDNNFEIKILFYAVVKREDFFNVCRECVTTNYPSLSFSKVIFVLTPDFDSSEHSILKRKTVNFLKKHYASNDIVITSDIKRWGFDNSIDNPNFTNVLDRVNYMNSLKTCLL